MEFLAYLFSGLSLGSIYAIIALGYTMVYGIAKMLNFAHGDVIMLGAYLVFMCMSSAGMPAVVSIVIAIACCTAIGIIIEKIAYKPLRRATNLAVLITAIGVSYFLQNMALMVFGSNPVSFTSVVSWPGLSLAGGQLKITGNAIVTIITCLIVMFGLMWFVKNTKPGQAMRAVSEDKDAATLMGINVNATISLTFAIGSGLAAIAGAPPRNDTQMFHQLASAMISIIYIASDYRCTSHILIQKNIAGVPQIRAEKTFSESGRFTVMD